MALLTAGEDELRYDPLRDNNGKGYDPLSKQASKRIRIYDKDLKTAMHPEEKDAALAYRDNVAQTADSQQAELDTYKKGFKKTLAAADKKAQGLLGGIRNVGGQDKIPVSITGNGQVESTHYVNKGWAEEFLPTLNSSSKGQYEPKQNGDGSWWIDAQGYGKELRDLIVKAEDQTALQDNEINAANKGIDKVRGGAESLIASQRSEAIKTYNQDVDQATAVIEETRGLWTNYLKQQQTAFTKGVQTNTGGIRDLLSSGALVVKGEAK